MADHNPDDKQKRQAPDTERIEISADNLMDNMRDLVDKGNMRRLLIRNANGDVLLDIPLTAGVITGVLFLLFLRFWLVVGAIAAVVLKINIEVVRVSDDQAAPHNADPISRLEGTGADAQDAIDSAADEASRLSGDV